MKEETVTVKILKSFLDARQGMAEQVMEKSTEPHINVTTYHQHDAEGNLLCEDIVVESRVSPFASRT